MKNSDQKPAAPSNTTQPSKYLAFLLRLRRDSELTPWRATIENPHTGERRGFAGLAQLILFLERLTGEQVIHIRVENDGGDL